jgi:hypothetical protein
MKKSKLKVAKTTLSIKPSTQLVDDEAVAEL